jgi:hypothetical protein
MEKVNSNIFKKFILPLASVFCSCTLYVSVANAKIDDGYTDVTSLVEQVEIQDAFVSEQTITTDEYTDVTSLVEQAEIQDDLVSQKTIATTTTGKLASNIADYTTTEKKPTKRNKVKDFFTKDKAKNTAFVAIGVSAFLAAIGIGFGGSKLFNKYTEIKKDKHTAKVYPSFIIKPTVARTPYITDKH